MADQDDKNAIPPRVRQALYVVGGISILCAVLHAVCPDRFDDKTAMFLGVAAAALLMPHVTKFKGFGFEIEQLKEDVKSMGIEVKSVGNEVKGVGNVVEGLEKALGPGSKSAVAAPGTAQPAVPGTVVDPDDPNKGQFGGSPERNGRRLRAVTKPLAGPRSARCGVNIRVESTDPARPLTGTVKLHLHPTFGEWYTYDLDVVRGVAADDIVSYGAFTIGAVADGGATRLELDLMDVPGGTEQFYAQ